MSNHPNDYYLQLLVTAGKITQQQADEMVEIARFAGALPHPGKPVAWMTHHDTPMLFFSKKEAEQYCDDDEHPIPLYAAPHLGEPVKQEPVIYLDEHTWHAIRNMPSSPYRETRVYRPVAASSGLDLIPFYAAPQPQPELWCLHIIGPDDVHPAPSKAHAEAAAKAFIACHKAEADQLDVMCDAVAAPWPHSAESHAEHVGKFIELWMLPRWQVEAMKHPQPQAVDSIVIAAMNDGFSVAKGVPSSDLTDEANAKSAWVVHRSAAPWKCAKGGINWVGPTLVAAIDKAREAMGMPATFDAQAQPASAQAGSQGEHVIFDCRCRPLDAQYSVSRPPSDKQEYAAIAGSQPSAQELKKRLDDEEEAHHRTLKERDHAEKIIDELCDVVLGSDRNEWSSAYFFEDAVEEVKDEITRLRTVPSLPTERRAPVQRYHGNTIPWHVHGLAWEAYAKKYGRGQSAERIAERGGFGIGEMDEFLPGWRDMAERPRVPEGWVPVPVEPTDRMTGAGARSKNASGAIFEIWKAMIAAAPKGVE